MKKAIFSFIALAFILPNVSNNLFSQAKSANSGFSVGIVDVEAIVKEMPEAVTADKDLIDLAQKYQDSIIAKKDILDTKYQNFEKQKSMMAQAKQTEEMEKLQKEMMDLQTYQNDKRTEIEKKREELLEPIRKRVKEAIETVAKDEKLSLVLTKDATSVVMYFDAKMDITFRVIDKMKRGN